MHRTLLAWVILASLSGCASTEVVTGYDSTLQREQEDQEFDARLRAADAIRDDTRRDQALAGVAKLAADVARADVARAALDKMRRVEAQDRAASDCAVTLASLGDFEGARLIADRIHDTEVRDEALLRVAESQ